VVAVGSSNTGEFQFVLEPPLRLGRRIPSTSDAGQAIGWSGSHGFLWQKGVMTDIGADFQLSAITTTWARWSAGSLSRTAMRRCGRTGNLRI
jgi:hypothetical protein